MPQGKALKSSDAPRKTRPALSPEARENQLISLAVDLAERQLLDGTASAQVVTHYLRLGSTKERIEKEILISQKGFLEAKTEAMQSSKNAEKMYADALAAMRDYTGNGGEDD